MNPVRITIRGPSGRRGRARRGGPASRVGGPLHGALARRGARALLHCDCGFEASGVDEDELVTKVQRHAWEVYGMALSHDEALLVAFHAELRENAPPAVPLRRTTEEARREQTESDE